MIDLPPRSWAIRNETFSAHDLLPISGPALMRLCRVVWPRGIPEVEA